MKEYRLINDQTHPQTTITVLCRIHFYTPGGEYRDFLRIERLQKRNKQTAESSREFRTPADQVTVNKRNRFVNDKYRRPDKRAVAASHEIDVL